MNLILDMDGTLISGNDFTNDVYVRPYLENFLEECFMIFNNVSIWTAASKEWFNVVNQKVFIPLINLINERKGTTYKFHFIFTREKCKHVYKYNSFYNCEYDNIIVRTEKRLRKLHKSKSLYKEYTMDNTVIIDDTKETFDNNYSNGILVTSYFSPIVNRNDKVLLKLLTYFKNILIPHYNEHTTIRNLEKRYWKTELISQLKE